MKYDRTERYGHDDAGRSAIIRAEGDMTDSQRIRSFLARSNSALADRRYSAILLDLRDGTPVDTKLIAAVVLVCRAAIPRQCTLHLLPSQPLRDWVHICQLDALFDSITILTAQRRVQRLANTRRSAERRTWSWRGITRGRAARSTQRSSVISAKRMLATSC